MFGKWWFFFHVAVILAAALAKKEDLKVSKGQLTFDAEGTDNPRSRYFSRKLHVPSRWSGATIGRGYDMKYKSRRRVQQDMVKAGVESKHARKLARFVGLAGQRAKNKIKAEKLQGFTITTSQQKNLFKITYSRQEKEAKRLVQKYYKIKWNSLQLKIQEMFVDLKFRGDFRPRRQSAAMKGLKKAAMQNSLAELKKVMSKRANWRNVPYDRFRRRRNYVQ